MNAMYGVEDLPATGLSEVSVAAAALVKAYAEKERKEVELAVVAANILKLETDTLPAAMRVLGVEKLTLTSGEIVSVKDEVGIGVTEANRDAAYNWLRAHGADSMIKRVVAVAFGKGEDGTARELQIFLAQKFPDNQIVDKADVHYQTLKAYVKERLASEKELKAAGVVIPDPLPRDVFGVFEQQRATIKKPKKENE